MIVGIDLGTTNSLIGVIKDGEPVLIKNTHGSVLTPSVVSVDEDGSILIGEPAAERLLTHPEATVAHFKRYMGSDREINLSGQNFRPEELSSLILTRLKEDAEEYLGETITEAVISVPAYFNDTQRKATRLAGQLAGLNVERLINEPTAAGLAYGLHEKDKESKFLVFDLGGGTFDVSIVEMCDQIMEIHASTGDNYLGGEDFTKAIVNEFINQSGINDRYSDEEINKNWLAKIRSEAERAKKQITSTNSVELTVCVKDENFEWSFTEASLKQFTSTLIERLKKPIDRALADSKIDIADIDDVILVGGATRMQIIRGLASKIFKKFPLSTINPDEAVAIGAAIQAGLKARDTALSEIVVTDVCPYTLGIDCLERFTPHSEPTVIFFPIIERNTVIPCSKSRPFYPVHPDQQKMVLTVYQGESRNVAMNIKLGTLTIDLPSEAPKNKIIDVRFTYDINGLLEVEVTICSTGEVQRLIIENNSGSLSEEEIQNRLKKLSALKVHPREVRANRLLLAKAERLYEESLGGARTYIGDMMTQFKLLLEEQKSDRIDEFAEFFRQELLKIEAMRS